MKRFLFYLGHPAHYHNVRIVAQKLMDKGHKVLFVAREKDVLLQLLKDSPIPVKVVARHSPKTGKVSRILTLLLREWKMLWIALRFRPHVMAGTDPVITHVGKLLGRKTVVINEDDADQVPLFVKTAYPYATALLAPEGCRMGDFEEKTAFYPGYHELAYLHPDYFTPDRSRVTRLFGDRSRFFLLRFAQLSAHHDVGRTGITLDLAREIVAKLEPLGHVWITSERELETEFEKYRIQIAPQDIHHAMHFADLYIGDSQTMAAEAAILGTPSLRFNDFVGKLTYLEDLEHTHQLTAGIPTDEPDRLLEAIDRRLADPSLQSTWQKRREKMLETTIDVASFWTWYFESFPTSHTQWKKGEVNGTRFGGPTPNQSKPLN